jgi:lipid-binding SYLF domain-containing protein
MTFRQELRPALRLGPFILVLAVALLAGCAVARPEDPVAMRSELDEMADDAIARLLTAKPEVSAVQERSVGYMVIDKKVTKIPVFGFGGGSGVVVDRRSGSRTYLKVTRFEIGGGLGAQRFRVIVFFDDERLVDKITSGAWHYDVGAEAGAGTSDAVRTSADEGEGYHAFRLNEGGAAATATVRVMRARPFLE